MRAPESRRLAVFIAEVKSTTTNSARAPGSGRFSGCARGSGSLPTATASGLADAIRLAWGGGSGDATARGVGARGTLAAAGSVVRFVEPPIAELSCRPVATGAAGSVAAAVGLVVLEAIGTRSPPCDEAA